MQRRTLLASLAASALPASTARATSGFMTTADNRRLAYIDRGRGAPVVFIHGWSLGSAIWTPADRLAGGARIARRRL